MNNTYEDYFLNIIKLSDNEKKNSKNIGIIISKAFEQYQIVHGKFNKNNNKDKINILSELKKTAYKLYEIKDKNNNPLLKIVVVDEIKNILNSINYINGTHPKDCKYNSDQLHRQDRVNLTAMAEKYGLVSYNRFLDPKQTKYLVINGSDYDPEITKYTLTDQQKNVFGFHVGLWLNSPTFLEEVGMCKKEKELDLYVDELRRYGIDGFIRKNKILSEVIIDHIYQLPKYIKIFGPSKPINSDSSMETKDTDQEKLTNNNNSNTRTAKSNNKSNNTNINRHDKDKDKDNRASSSKSFLSSSNEYENKDIAVVDNWGDLPIVPIATPNIVPTANEKTDDDSSYCSQDENIAAVQKWHQIVGNSNDHHDKNIISATETKTFDPKLNPNYLKSAGHLYRNKIEFDGKEFIEIDLKSAFFQTYYEAKIIECDTWSKFLSQFTKSKFLATSKKFRLEIFSKLDLKSGNKIHRQMTTNLLNNVLNILTTNITNIENILISKNEDQLLFYPKNSEDLKCTLDTILQLMESKILPQHYLTVTHFRLKHVLFQEKEFYQKIYSYPADKSFDIKCLDKHLYTQTYADLLKVK